MDEKHAVEAIIQSWSDAISKKDAARVMSHLTDDVVQFTLAPPLKYEGRDAEDLAAWFATWEGPIGGEARDTRIEASGEVAFARSLVHMTGTKTDGETVDLWFRQTLGLVKQEGTWRIAHVHTSVPFYMDGSLRGAFDLKP
ncbi:MAG: SgcJ/EcaC family oxidoreductase [Phyllobacterium sp.]|uniref:YybH family protein n=1 Tax=Phyllobacterium sp. TaxID=1871046 RepID=UPI0030F1F61C